MNMKRAEGKPHKPERELIMKKATIETVRDALIELGYDNIEILRELDAELMKGEAQKAKNAEAYESIHTLIVDTLTDNPATVSEIWEAIEDEVPEGITKGKVQYALTHLWQDEIVKVEGKPNGYKRA